MVPGTSSELPKCGEYTALHDPLPYSPNHNASRLSSGKNILLGYLNPLLEGFLCCIHLCYLPEDKLLDQMQVIDVVATPREAPPRSPSEAPGHFSPIII
jgi:hypothetical protein